ncbi:MAG TPA: lipopolysaccharide heptosyltransferase II [Woeseiaceae bacterium]|nr:lipopolysaccharide heptosyltransferase II [Woeseiaceae bacterium]
MVMAQSLFRMLRQRQPESVIDVLAPAWSLPIVARMPEVRRAVESPIAHGELTWAEHRGLGRRLRSEGYDQAIVLPRSLKAALVPWHARIPRRTGFRGEMRFGLINDMRAFDRRVLDQTVKRFVALGLDPGETLPPTPSPRLELSAAKQRTALARLQLPVDEPVIALMPGAEYGSAKCWPPIHFRTLAGMLRSAGYAVWVLGSEKDRPAGDIIAAGGRAANLCGRTSLEEVIDLLGCCRQAVTNDSGLMHVAAAVGLRVVALFGSTTPDFTPPLTENRAVHWLGIACSPCFRRECPFGHRRCLRDITPAMVMDSLIRRACRP